jgi:hypothetical protein
MSYDHEIAVKWVDPLTMAVFTERFNGPSLGETCSRLDPKISRGKKEIPYDPMVTGGGKHILSGYD